MCNTHTLMYALFYDSTTISDLIGICKHYFFLTFGFLMFFLQRVIYIENTNKLNSKCQDIHEHDLLYIPYKKVY